MLVSYGDLGALRERAAQTRMSLDPLGSIVFPTAIDFTPLEQALTKAS